MEIRTLTLKGIWQINARFGINVWNCGPMLVNKVRKKWQKSKSVINISCTADFIFFSEKKFGWIRIIFDIENWLWLSEFCDL